MNAFDWVAVSLNAILALGFPIMAVYVRPVFVMIMEDFEATLPTITRIVFTDWFAPACLLGMCGFIALALFGTRSRAAARTIFGLTFVAGLALMAIYWFALFAPIFAIADGIQ